MKLAFFARIRQRLPDCKVNRTQHTLHSGWAGMPYLHQYWRDFRLLRVTMSVAIEIQQLMWCLRFKRLPCCAIFIRVLHCERDLYPIVSAFTCFVCFISLWVFLRSLSLSLTSHMMSIVFHTFSMHRIDIKSSAWYFIGLTPTPSFNSIEATEEVKPTKRLSANDQQSKIY